MAKARKNNNDWGGYGSKQAYVDAIKSGKVKMETMAGGNLKSLLTSAATRLAAPARNVAQNIGSFVAETADEAARFVPKTGRTVRPKGEVFTPEGVFKGKDVFIKKPDLTSKQIAAVQKGLDTKAARQFAREFRVGTKGAGYGMVAGGATVAGAYELGGTVKKVVKKARGGGTKKK